MKKVILTILAVSALTVTSCKKAKESAEKGAEGLKNATEKVVDGAAKEVTEAADKTVEAVKGAISNVAGIEVPSFKNEEVNTYVKSYVEYAQSYIKNKGNVLKDGLAAKGQKLISQSKDMSSKLDNEGSKKLADFMTKLNEKMSNSTK